MNCHSRTPDLAKLPLCVAYSELMVGRLRHWSAPNYRGTIYQTPRLISPPGADAEIEYLYQRSETGSVPRRCGEGADKTDYYTTATDGHTGKNKKLINVRCGRVQRPLST
jgi:hypothetical protein